MTRTLPIANGIAYLLMVVVNYLSNTGIFNGNTMETISDRYENFFTPAGYAFSIWGLIYLGLLGFVLHTGRRGWSKKGPDEHMLKIGWWFVLSCVANMLWVVTWLYDYTGVSVLIMVFLLLCLVKIILNLRMELDAHPLKKYVFIFWPFALYAGWITVALIANIAAWLTKLNWDGWGISETTWTVIMVVAAGLINVLVVISRNLREFGVVGIWGLIAIAVANNQDDGATAIVYTCFAVAAIILVFMIINALKYKGRSFSSM